MTTHYVWDELSDNVLMETDENGTPTAVYTHEPGQFGELISQKRNGQTSFYHYDGQGSTRQLTDESGDVTDEYTYTAFGETVAESGTTENAYRYKGSVGYYTDESPPNVYVRARRYEPRRGRWLSKDPLGLIGSTNAYMYAANRAGTRTDPSGLLDFTTVSSCIDTCGVFQWQTRWVLGAEETDGYIIQQVCVNTKVTDCREPPCKLIEPDCSNTTKRTERCYFELWRVHNHEVYIRDPFSDAPSVRNPDDIFGFFGCADRCGEGATRGFFHLEGDAFFIPKSVADASSAFRECFKEPPNGMKPACDLASGQGDVCEKVFRALRRTRQRSRPLVHKSVERDWNCCNIECVPCPKGDFETDPKLTNTTQGCPSLP